MNSDGPVICPFCGCTYCEWRADGHKFRCQDCGVICFLDGAPEWREGRIYEVTIREVKRG